MATGAAWSGSWMSVSTGTPTVRFTVVEHRETGVEAGAAVRRDRGAVGLVERRLEHVVDAARRAHVTDAAGDVHAVRLGLDHARAAEERERAVADGQRRRDVDDVYRIGHDVARRIVAAT